MSRSCSALLLMTAMLFVTAEAQPQDNGWSTAGGSNIRAWRAAGGSTGVPTATQRWAARSSAGDGPVLAQGGSIVLSGDTLLSAFSTASGASLYNDTMPYSRTAWKSVSVDGSIHIPLQYTFLIFVLNSTYHVTWFVQRESGSASRGDSLISSLGYFVTTWYDGYMIAYDTSGNERWAFNTGENIVGTPAEDAAGNLYVVTDDSVMSLSASGQRQWRLLVPFNGYGALGPALGTTKSLLFAAAEDAVFALDLKTGNDLVWHTVVPNAYTIHGNIALAPNDASVYVGVELDSFEDVLVALDGGTGDILWKYALLNTFEGAAVDAQGNVHIFDSYTGVALSPSGDILFSYAMGTNEYVTAPPSIGRDGTLYLHTSAGLRAFAPRTITAPSQSYVGIIAGSVAAGAVCVVVAAVVALHVTGRIRLPFLPSSRGATFGEARPLLDRSAPVQPTAPAMTDFQSVEGQPSSSGAV